MALSWTNPRYHQPWNFTVQPQIRQCWNSYPSVPITQQEITVHHDHGGNKFSEMSLHFSHHTQSYPRRHSIFIAIAMRTSNLKRNYYLNKILLHTSKLHALEYYDSDSRTVNSFLGITNNDQIIIETPTFTVTNAMPKVLSRLITQSIKVWIW